MTVKKAPCRVCGKMFVPCAYCQEHYGASAWRAVCCCLECGVEYFRQVEIARSKSMVTPVYEEKEIMDSKVVIDTEQAKFPDHKTETEKPNRQTKRKSLLTSEES